MPVRRGSDNQDRLIVQPSLGEGVEHQLKLVADDIGRRRVPLRTIHGSCSATKSGRAMAISLASAAARSAGLLAWIFWNIVSP